jgi:hypothetical protein
VLVKNARKCYAFAVRLWKKRTTIYCLCYAPLEKTHDNLLPWQCAFGKNARQSIAFVVRLWNKRITINGSFVVCFNKTHGKVTFVIFFVFHV